MNVDVDPMRFDFHDTSLVGASQLGSTICLTIEYFTEDDVEASAGATIVGVEEILRNDVPIPEFKMETTHGSIVVLERQDQDVVLLVDWVDFLSKSRTTCFYRMLGATIRLLAEPR